MSNSFQTIRALRQVHKTVKMRAMRAALESMGKDPDSVDDNVDLLRTLGPVMDNLSKHLMDEMLRDMIENEACLAEQMKTWYTAMQVHGTLEEAIKSLIEED